MLSFLVKFVQTDGWTEGQTDNSKTIPGIKTLNSRAMKRLRYTGRPRHTPGFCEDKNINEWFVYMVL